MNELTHDTLLGGRVRLLQPAGGLRAAIDAVLLAASVPAAPGERVLDLGCGSGAAGLCLAVRVAGVRVTGLDLQADLVGLANRSAALNELVDRAYFIAGDLLDPPAELASAIFDHVMANPPFQRAGAGRVSPDPARAQASVEGAADLAAWVAFARAHVRDGGTVTFIHRADRAGELADLFARTRLDTLVCPLGSKRVLVQGRAGGAGVLRHLPAIALHEPDGSFTPPIEAALRGAAGLPISDV